MKVNVLQSYRLKTKKNLKHGEIGASEHVCKLPVRKLEQNRWSLIAVLYNKTIEESLAITWKLDEVQERVSTDYQRQILTIPRITYRIFFHFTEVRLRRVVIEN